MLHAESLSALVESYVLTHDLAPNTVAFYRRQMFIFVGWLRLRIVSEVTEETVSRFLLDKQAQGKSSYYRRSLRNGIKAVIGDALDWRKIRPVRLDQLDVVAFSRLEVAKLIRATLLALPPYKREYYRLMIQMAYYTGLSQCDLHRVKRTDIAADGTLLFRRSKTRSESVTFIPAHLLDQLGQGVIFPRRWSNEQFRRDFQAICRTAGVVGTFKTLRKTSGTEAERIRPGEGHKHLANTRKVFEKHYDARHEKRKPIKLRSVRVG